MIDLGRKHTISLGCGIIDQGPDCVHVDCRRTPVVDIVANLDLFPWPFADEAFELIIAHDILEHVDDAFGFMQECWRILVPYGEMKVRMPNWAHPSGQGYRAMDHKRQGHEESLDVFVRDTPYFKGYSWYSFARFDKLDFAPWGAELVWRLRKAPLDNGSWDLNTL